MATRDLTTDYISLRNSLKGVVKSGNEKDNATFLDPEAATSNVEVPQWVEAIEKVKELEDNIRGQLATLRELHVDHLKPKIGKDKEKDREEQMINTTTNEIKEMMAEAEKTIRRMMESEGDLRYLSSDQQKLHENVRISVVTSMNTLQKAFRAEQEKYYRAMRNKKKMEGKLGGGPAYNDEGGQDPFDRGFEPSAAVQETIQSNRAIVEERDAEMRAIYRSIVDLHEVFKDLNTMVIDQGTLLDRIDHNMEETRTSIRQANKEFEQAANYQKKSRFCLLVMLLCVIIIGLIFGLLFKVWKKS